MTPNERKAALIIAEVKHREIAKRTGFSEQYVSEVIGGGRTNGKIEREVARAIRRPVREVFPPKEMLLAKAS